MWTHSTCFTTLRIGEEKAQGSINKFDDGVKVATRDHHVGPCQKARAEAEAKQEAKEKEEASKARAQAAAEKKAAKKERQAAGPKIFDEVLCASCVSELHVAKVCCSLHSSGFLNFVGAFGENRLQMHGLYLNDLYAM